MVIIGGRMWFDHPIISISSSKEAYLFAFLSCFKPKNENLPMLHRWCRLMFLAWFSKTVLSYSSIIVDRTKKFTVRTKTMSTIGQQVFWLSTFRENGPTGKDTHIHNSKLALSRSSWIYHLWRPWIDCHPCLIFFKRGKWARHHVLDF